MYSPSSGRLNFDFSCQPPWRHHLPDNIQHTHTVIHAAAAPLWTSCPRPSHCVSYLEALRSIFIWFHTRLRGHECLREKGDYLGLRRREVQLSPFSQLVWPLDQIIYPKIWAVIDRHEAKLSFSPTESVSMSDILHDSFWSNVILIILVEAQNLQPCNSLCNKEVSLLYECERIRV